MYTHVQILALAKVADIPKTVKVLEGLANKIDSVEQIEVGVQQTRADRAGHIAVIARFADQDAYEAFRAHPEFTKTESFLERVEAHAVGVSYPDGHE